MVLSTEGYLLSAQSVVKAASSQVSCDLNDEAVILNLADGVYYGLNPVGSRIWVRIQESTVVADLCQSLLGDYDVEPDRCLNEVLMLLQDLAGHGLIEVSGEASS